MIKIIHVMNNEIKLVMHRKSYFIFNFAAPLAILIIIFIMNNQHGGGSGVIPTQGENHIYEIGIVEGAGLSIGTIRDFKYTGNVVKIRRLQNKNMARTYLQSGLLEEAYVLPDKAEPPYTVTRLCVSGCVRPNLSGEIFRLTLVEKSATNPEFRNVYLHPPVRTSTQWILPAVRSDDDRLMVSSFLFILILLTLITSGYLFQSFMAERSHSLLENLLGVLRPYEFICGKLLGALAASLFPVVFWIIALNFTVGHWFPAILQDILAGTSTLLLLLPFMVMGILMFSTLLMAAVVAGSSAREGQQIATMLIICVLLTLQYLLIVRGGSPDFNLMRIFALAPPFTAPLAAVLLIHGQLSGIGYGLYCLASLVYIILGITAVARLLKATIYLTGSRGRAAKLLWLLVRGEQITIF